VLLNETLTIPTVAGMAVILSGIVLSNLRRTRVQTTAEPRAA
jgi:drug/metabolite transporter (DMT)-like permease